MLESRIYDLLSEFNEDIKDFIINESPHSVIRAFGLVGFFILKIAIIVLIISLFIPQTPYYVGWVWGVALVAVIIAIELLWWYGDKKEPNKHAFGMRPR